MSYDLQFLVNLAKSCSPFYKKLYAELPQNFKLQDIPVIDPLVFDEAVRDPMNNSLLTRPERGLVLKSGGTTGGPKYTFYSKEEWEHFSRLAGSLHDKYEIIKNGDRLMYLLGCGNLYGGMFLGYQVQMFSQSDTLILLQGHQSPLDDILKTLQYFSPNIIFSPAPTFIKIIQKIQEQKLQNIRVDRYLICGDLIQVEQYEAIKEFFPNIIINNDFYASTDAGFIGFSDPDCGLNEFREFKEYAEIEIIDGDGQLIELENKEGNIISTNYTRTLMPVIRYPVGDIGYWCEPKESKNRKFKLTGRAIFKEKIISLVGCAVDYYVIRNAITTCEAYSKIDVFQVIIDTKNNKDRLIINYTTNKLDADQRKKFENEVIDNIYNHYPDLKEIIEEDKLNPFEIKHVGYMDLDYNPLSSKLNRLTDYRNSTKNNI